MIDVLIVEDDASSREALSAWLGRQGFDCRAAGGVEEARRLMGDQLPDMALLDLELPDGSGLDLLAELGPARDTEVLMISGETTVEAAIDALRLGARDFLTKPVDMARLSEHVERLKRTARLRDEVRSLRGELRKLGRFGDLIGASPAMQEVYDKIERVAPTEETVLLLGETGTGKEVTAATIHRLSGRASGPFVAVNCGAVPEALIESQFFGHERGAFTGADRRHKGVFEQAHGGTLLLDEITEMPAELQVRLLRVLEESRVTRVGGAKEIEVDVRIIAATNRDPEQAVRDGRLRQDLLFRLFVFPVELPPLRERDGDVPLLAQAFLERLNAEHETTKSIVDAAMDRLRSHDWPGNVRELDNAVRRAFVMAETHIEPEHVPVAADAPAAGTTGGPAAAGGDGQDGVVVPLGSSIAEGEQALIEATLEHLEGDKKQASAVLGISLKTLYARLKVYRARREEGAG